MAWKKEHMNLIRGIKTVATSLIILGIVFLNTSIVYAANDKNIIDARTLNVAIQREPKNLNYFDPYNYSVWKEKMLGLLYESLLSYTPDLMLYKVLAEDYTQLWRPENDDVLTLIVNIRKNVYFHDGEPLTAKDVVFSYQVLYWNPLYKNRLQCLYWSESKWERWDGEGKSHIGVEMMDDYTVKFHLSQNYSIFFYSTLEIPIIPEHIWKDHLKKATLDSDDMRLDYNYGKDMNESQATVGTSPWKFVEWKERYYITLEVNDRYWGKHYMIYYNDTFYPFYPYFVRKITFKFYSTDVAILALKEGEVDLIGWPVTLPYYSPYTYIDFYLSDSLSFNYLGFNLRKIPLADNNFRKAVAFCVDKDYIVDRLLNGCGSKGTVPIPPASAKYINKTAKPPEFDLEKASQILDESGYVDINGDGWRDLPNGSSIELTILTLPRNYSDVDAYAGNMIFQNLKNVGLCAEWIQVDEDNLRKKVFIDTDFDLYIHGWTVSSFPEEYLYEFFHSSEAAPAGYNAPGYSNPRVDKLLEQIMTEMDDEKRVKMIKDIEGILVNDLPYDVLYYRKNAEAYRKDRWSDWVSAFGTIFNRYSLSIIVPPYYSRYSVPSQSKVGNHLFLVDAWTLPEVAPNTLLPIEIFVHNELNEPYPEAEVEVYSSMGIFLAARTDSDGFAIIKLETPDYRTTVNFKIVARYQNATAVANLKTEVLAITKGIYANIYVMDPVLNCGESTTVVVKVIDELENPVEGATVSIDENTMLGSVDSAQKTTNANGTATFTYTTPSASLITNRNLGDLLKVHVEYNGLTFDTSYVIDVQNNEPSSWYIVNILSISDTVLAAGESADVTVQVTDIDGNPVANHDVYLEIGYTLMTDPYNWVIEYFVDTQNVTADSYHKTTNASGMATFTITAQNNVNDVRFVKAYVNDSYSTYDVDSVYVGNKSGINSDLFIYTGMYSLNITVNCSMIDINGRATATFTVLNDSGYPVSNAVIWMKIPPSDYGQPAYLQGGLADGFLQSVGAYSMVVTDINGQATINIIPRPSIRDMPINLIAWVDNLLFGDNDTLGKHAGFWSAMPLGSGAVQQMVLQRAPVMTANISFDKMVLNPDCLSTTMVVSILGPDGPIDAKLNISWHMDNMSGYARVGTVDGRASLTLVSYPFEKSIIIKGFVEITSDFYAQDIPIPFSLLYIPDDEEYRNMVENSLFVSLESPPVVTAGNKTKIRVNVTDINGHYVYAYVTIFGINVTNTTVFSESNGIAEFTYMVEDVPGYKLNVIKLLAREDDKESKPTSFGILVKGEYPTMKNIRKDMEKLHKIIDNLTSQNEYLKSEIEYTRSVTYSILAIAILVNLGIIAVKKRKTYEK